MKKITTKHELPKGITNKDLQYPSYKSSDRLAYDDARLSNSGSFELIHVIGWGWCISTLLIRKAGRRSSESAISGGARVYAVRVDTGETVRVGLGPHVDERVQVYVRKSRVKALERYINLLVSGATRANQIRDRISTRRAQSAFRRYAW